MIFLSSMKSCFIICQHIELVKLSFNVKWWVDSLVDTACLEVHIKRWLPGGLLLPRVNSNKMAARIWSGSCRARKKLKLETINI